jgi:hypothetical protein
MRTAVIAEVAVAIGCLSACGQAPQQPDDPYKFDLLLGIDHHDHDRDKDHDRDHDRGRYSQQQQQAPDPDPMPLQTAPPPAAIDPKCINATTVTQIRFKGDKLFACTDAECATFSRATGRFLKTDGPDAQLEVDDTATATTTDATDPPDPDADDPRAKLTDDMAIVEACAEDSACIRIMPLVKDGETIDSVKTDAKHRGVAVTITGDKWTTTRVEVWDITTGKLRGRAKYAGLDDDFNYSFVTRPAGDGFVTYAKRDSDSLATAWSIGLDGARHPLAGGASHLNMDAIVEVDAGTLAFLDEPTPTKPTATVYVDAVPSGAQLVKAPIPRIGDEGDDISLLKMEHGMLGVSRWKSDSGTSKTSDAKLRVDVIDPHGGARTFVAPGC